MRDVEEAELDEEVDVGGAKADALSMLDRPRKLAVELHDQGRVHRISHPTNSAARIARTIMMASAVAAVSSSPIGFLQLVASEIRTSAAGGAESGGGQPRGR